MRVDCGRSIQPLLNADRASQQVNVQLNGRNGAELMVAVEDADGISLFAHFHHIEKFSILTLLERLCDGRDLRAGTSDEQNSSANVLGEFVESGICDTLAAVAGAPIVADRRQLLNRSHLEPARCTLFEPLSKGFAGFSRKYLADITGSSRVEILIPNTEERQVSDSPIQLFVNAKQTASNASHYCLLC